MSPGCEEAYFQAENTGLTLGINGLKTASLTRMFEHHNSAVSTKDCLVCWLHSMLQWSLVVPVLNLGHVGGFGKSRF